jgi:hypothetical protein
MQPFTAEKDEAGEADRAIGALIRKIARHETYSVQPAAESVGPIIAPEQRAHAEQRDRWAVPLGRVDIEQQHLRQAARRSPPSRPAGSGTAPAPRDLGDMPQPIELSVKPTTEIAITRLRPKRSGEPAAEAACDGAAGDQVRGELPRRSALAMRRGSIGCAAAR